MKWFGACITKAQLKYYAKEDSLAKEQAICIYSDIIKSVDSSKNMCILQRLEI